MSLQVWLPLNGDLHNQGLISLPDTSVNTFSYSNGKIGQCATGRVAWHLDDEILGNTWSVAMWVKPESLGTANNVLFCKNGTSSTDCHIYFSIISTTRLNLGVNGPSSSVTATGQTFTTGTWYHVAATYDGTTATIYLNGVELKHDTVTTACPTGRLNMNINGRSTNAANTGVTGHITCSFNDFRLYDNCLSAAEIKEISQGLVLHYKLDSPYIEPTTNLLTAAESYANLTALPVKHATSTSTAYNDGTITRSAGNNIVTYSAYITNISNGYIYPRIRGLTEDGSTWGSYVNGNRIPAGESGWVQVSLDMTDASTYNGTSVYLRWQLGVARNAITENPIIQYAQLEVGDHRTPWVLGGTSRNETNIEDSSGYNSNGTINGNITIAPNSGRYSNCIYIPSGNTDYITTNEEIGNFLQGITTSIWFKSNNKTPGNNYHEIFNIATATQNIEHAIHINGFFRGGMIINGTRYIANTNNNNLLDGNWHHIAMTYDGSVLRRYVDGIDKSDSNVSGTLTLTSCKFLFGHYGTNTSYYAKEAYLSDIRIYCTALSADDILQLYHTGAKIGNKADFHTYEINENDTNKLTKTGIMYDNMEESIMTLPDGSHWQLLMFHYVDNGNNLFTKSNALYCNDFGLFSRLQYIDNFKYTDTTYEFYVIQDGVEYRWTQTNAPTATSPSGFSAVSGYANPIQGLVKNGGNTYFGYGSWWGACGCWTKWSTGGKSGIPGFGPHDATGTCSQYLALYARIPKTDVKLADQTANTSEFIEL